MLCVFVNAMAFRGLFKSAEDKKFGSVVCEKQQGLS